MPSREIFIGVVGDTGSGKSSFINAIVGSEDGAPISRSINSTTNDVEPYEYTLPGGQIIHLIDTPGFGCRFPAEPDTKKRASMTPLQILRNMGKTLGTVQFSYILILQNITNNRIGGLSLTEERLIGELCPNPENIIMVTTHWDHVTANASRAAELEANISPSNCFLRYREQKKIKTRMYRSGRGMKVPPVERYVSPKQIIHDLFGSPSIHYMSVGLGQTRGGETVEKYSPQQLEEIAWKSANYERLEEQLELVEKERDALRSENKILSETPAHAPQHNIDKAPQVCVVCAESLEPDDEGDEIITPKMYRDAISILEEDLAVAQEKIGRLEAQLKIRGAKSRSSTLPPNVRRPEPFQEQATTRGAGQLRVPPIVASTSSSNPGGSPRLQQAHRYFNASDYGGARPTSTPPIQPLGSDYYPPPFATYAPPGHGVPMPQPQYFYPSN